MMDIARKKDAALEYNEEAKGWIGSRKEGLPPEVLAWMHCAQQATVDERVRRFMEHYAAMPWLVVPPCVSSSFPQLNGTDLAQLEANLGYKFCNCALLLEALTHPSRDTLSLTPSNAKLAFLGSLMAEALVANLMLDNTSFLGEIATHVRTPPKAPRGSGWAQARWRRRAARTRALRSCSRT